MLRSVIVSVSIGLLVFSGWFDGPCATAQETVYLTGAWPAASSSTRLTLRTSLALAESDAAAAADTLVLCPQPFIPALQPWLTYRRAQGHLIHVVSPTASAWGIKQQIRDIARHGNLKSLLLIGDTPSADPRSIMSCIPTDYKPAKVISKYGSEPEIATDNSFADIDEDGLPDLALGRIPVDTPEDLTRQIAKIIEYEATASGPWQRRINLVAGTGGFGQMTDSVIEQTARRLITELIPSEFCTSMTYASWSSAYCPDPREFAKTTIDRLNEGCLFWVYMGHGDARRLDYVRTPIGGYPILRERDIGQVNCQNGMPIAIMLACYTGAFDLPKDCLSEQLVKQPGGPIAVLCGSRLTMPYGMGMLSVGLIEEYFDGERETLGEILLAAKRKLGVPDGAGEGLDDATHNEYRSKLKLLGETFSPSGEQLQTEAIEHVHLFHLLGDPLLRVARPASIQLAAEPTDEGDRVVVTGSSPHAGQLLLELVYCRDRFHERPPRRREFTNDPDVLTEYAEIYQKANCRTVSEQSVEVAAGPFRVELEVPEWARGRCVVRGFLQDDEQRYALGASDIKLERR
ncbi:MAG: C25 family cysteine peptidase [Pirellulaceae bacterium]